jgi:hypothetical protein
MHYSGNLTPTKNAAGQPAAAQNCSFHSLSLIEKESEEISSLLIRTQYHYDACYYDASDGS